MLILTGVVVLAFHRIKVGDGAVVAVVVPHDSTVYKSGGSFYKINKAKLEIDLNFKV